MKKFIPVIFLVLFLGCASTEKIEQGFKDVNYSDGVNALEAKRIAQRFLLDQPNGKSYAISAPEVDAPPFAHFPEWKDKAWVIGFSKKSLNPFECYGGTSMSVIGVDKKTGNIRFYYDGWCSSSGLPKEMHGYGDEGIPVK